MQDDELAVAVTSVRRGVLRLARRLRLEGRERGEALLRIGVLAHLVRHGAMTPGELAAMDQVQPQTLTRTLATLEREGLISRRPDDDDRRRSLLNVTDAGRGLLESDMRGRERWLAGAMAAELTPAECEILRIAGSLMERLGDSAGGSTRRTEGGAVTTP
ncbi:MAG TPA: MarR family transcriptional regulator [Candidatus Dormibacteraeota bacterium]|jgi:DNA-binding MarR family transcriptional regulator|nr:MarR family transcriptional regulator [Candidatus Dormibacteraeota bacterium]